jgi:hypothetical protein
MKDGDADLAEMLKRIDTRLDRVVARLAIWAHPDAVSLLKEEEGNQNASWMKGIRRHRPAKNEPLGLSEDGMRLDRNNYANHAIKGAAGLRKSIKNYFACHVWDASCYDPLLHTAIPNLVLLPRAIAGLSDFDPSTSAALRYRSYHLYRWHPPSSSIPERPEDYPTDWRSPEPFTKKIYASIKRRKKIA